MKRKRILSIAILVAFALTSFTTVSESSFAADSVSAANLKPNYCKSYKSIGAKMDQNLLAHKKSFKITVQEKHADFLNYYILYIHRKSDPYSIIRAGENLRIDLAVHSVVKSGSKHYYVFTLKPKYKHSAKKDRKFYKKVRSIAKKARRIKNKRKRIKYINNYLINNTRYVTKYPTAYDALIRGKGNCTAYSEAFTIIACHAGLSAETVAGHYKHGKRREPHAWNVVKLGKKWYNLDVTFNDQRSKRVRNMFFLMKNKTYKKTHRLHSHYKKIGWTKKHPLK